MLPLFEASPPVFMPGFDVSELLRLFFSLKVVYFVRCLLSVPPADSADISFVYSLPYGLQTPQITARYLSSSTSNSILSFRRISQQRSNFQPLLGQLAH